jgi:hypothetical protein
MDCTSVCPLREWVFSPAETPMVVTGHVFIIV